MIRKTVSYVPTTVSIDIIAIITPLGPRFGRLKPEPTYPELLVTSARRGAALRVDTSLDRFRCSRNLHTGGHQLIEGDLLE
jgi:hypothetical protein